MRTHVPVRTYANDQWQLRWFEYRGESADMRAEAP
jgi:hypothetical protein